MMPSERQFPVLIDGSRIKDQAGWLSENHDLLAEFLNKKGAVLLRDFTPSFQDLIYLLQLKDDAMDYIGGTSPRTKVQEGIYTSTKMPFFLKIPLHSEMAYRHSFPGIICFYCDQAPLLGGETHIVDLRLVQEAIPAALREELQRDGVIYYRHLKNFTPVRKMLTRLNPMIETGTWQHVFKTEDPKVVSEYCAKNKYQERWLPDGSVILETHLPATLDSTWFNSLHFFQVHHLIWGRLITAIYKLILMLFKMPDLSARTGKGRKLSASEISLIVKAYEQDRIAFRWKKKDLLILNNKLTAHGRYAYLGKRRILVALSRISQFSE